MKNARSITTMCFRSSSLEAALEGAAEAGFRNVELSAVKGFLEHVDPDDVSRRAIDHVHHALRRHGLTATSLSGHGDLASDEGLARHRRLVRLCDELGIEILNTFAGANRRSREARAALVRNARLLGDDAAGRALSICFENDGGEAGTGQEVASLLATIDHPAVRMNYDPANAIYFGGADVVEDIAFALPWIGHFHLKDQKGGKDVYSFPALGDGDVDVPNLLATLESAGYRGPVCIEIEFDGNAPQWTECVEAARASRMYWESVDAQG